MWSYGGGDFFKDFGSIMFQQAFPETRGVVWTHDPAVLLGPSSLPVAVVTHFANYQHAPLPLLVPAVFWSAEPDRVTIPWPVTPEVVVIAEWADAIVTMEDVFVPQWALRGVPAHTPPSLRLYDDNIASRPLTVAYVSSHCVERRERLFAEVLKVVGPAQARARGKCSRNDAQVEGIWTGDALLQSLSQFRCVIAVENSDIPGYVTEKILNAFLAGAVPIHGGASQYAKSVFNPKAFISIDDYGSLEEAARGIADICSNGTRLRAMRAEPIAINMARLNEALRWKDNNCSGFKQEIGVFRRRLLEAWTRMTDPRLQ